MNFFVCGLWLKNPSGKFTKKFTRPFFHPKIQIKVHTKNPYKNPYKKSFTTFAASEQLVTRAFFHALSWKGWGGGGEWGGLETGLGWGRWDEGCLSMGTESAFEY